MTRYEPIDTPPDAPELRTSGAFPPTITLAHLFNAPTGWNAINRTLSQYALQYVVKGVAIYTVEGTPYRTTQGNLLFHRPGELHSIETVEGEPYVCISLLFHYGVATPQAERLLPAGIHDLGNYYGHGLEQKLSQLIVHYRQPGLAHQVLAQGLLQQIIAEASLMLNENASSVTRRKAGNKAKLVLVRNHIADHLREPLDYRQLERLSGLSQNYIILQFKEAFGMPPIDYLLWQRINRAKELAIQTNLSVGEIAGEVGYANVHSFGKMFKKKTGSSLTEFCATLYLY